MATPLTLLHKWRVVDQIRILLTNLQRDMIKNATVHKAMAQAQSPPLATLQTFVADTASSYLQKTQWIIDLRNDPVKKQRFLDALATMNWPEADVIDVLASLRNVAVQMSVAPRSTYAEIVTLCDQILANVDPFQSLWPE